MGQTANYQFPYPELTDPADVPTDMRELAEAVDSKLALPAVTSLPGSPVDGQEVYYRAGSGNTVQFWRLRYVAAISDAYKWVMVGQGRLVHELDALESTTSASWANLTTAGPLVVCPLAGYYDLEFGSAILTPAAAGFYGMVAPVLGAGGTTTDTESIVVQTPATSALQVSAMKRRTGSPLMPIAAGGEVRLKYRSNAAGQTSSYFKRFLYAYPVRVG